MDQRVAVTWDRKAVEVAPRVSAQMVSAPLFVAKGTAPVPTVQATAQLLAVKEIVQLRVEKVPRAVKATAPVPMVRATARLRAVKAIVPVPMVRATARLRVVKATVLAPMAKAEAPVLKVIVPPLVAKATVHVLTAKAEALVQKVPRAVKATVVPKVPPLEDALIRKRCGSNSTRTAMAASRRRKLRSE